MLYLKKIQDSINDINKLIAITKHMYSLTHISIKDLDGMMQSVRLYTDSFKKISNVLLNNFEYRLNTYNEYSKLIYGANSAENKVLICVIGSDFGMCGSYNQIIFNELKKTIDQYEKNSIDYMVLPIGKKAQAFCSNIDKSKVFSIGFSMIADKFLSDSLEVLIDTILCIMIYHELFKLVVICNHKYYQNDVSLINEELLPLKIVDTYGSEKKETHGNLLYEGLDNPDFEEFLVKNYMFAFFYNIIIGSMVSAQHYKLYSMTKILKNSRVFRDHKINLYKKSNKNLVDIDFLSTTNNIK